MSDDLLNEIEAINSIYSPDSIVKVAEDERIYTLVLPTHPVTLRVSFPRDYPAEPPMIPGVQSIGDSQPKGYGNHVLELARGVLKRVFSPGQVCIFDLIEELEKLLEAEKQRSGDESTAYVSLRDQDSTISPPTPALTISSPAEWIHSAPVSQKKSLFIAHATIITHPSQLPGLIESLHATSKNISKATHNISAYRIRSPPQPASTISKLSNGEPGNSDSADRAIVYQDYDEDGETAAGGRLLHLMQIMDVWNVLVVVSRWYGGINLGPDRFRIIGNVARQVLVGGGWGKGQKELG